MLEREHYLVTMDYFSKYIEVDKLQDMSSTEAIDKLKTQIARHGIPEKLRSDNGPQFGSQEFTDFCDSHDINHQTSSPNFPQFSGQAERAVQIVRRLWTKFGDKHMALSDYRSTPLSCELSPAQLNMSRRLRTTVQMARNLLVPSAYDQSTVRKKFEEAKEAQRFHHDRKAGDDLPVLVRGHPARMAPFPKATRNQ